MKGLYVNTTERRRSFQQIESSDGGNIPGLHAVKCILYLGGRIVSEHDWCCYRSHVRSTGPYRYPIGVLSGPLQCRLRARVADVTKRQKQPIGLVLRFLFARITKTVLFWKRARRS